MWGDRSTSVGAAILLFLAGRGFVRADQNDHAGLSQAIAEAAQTDPHWTLEDWERHRRVMPDAENAALRVLSADRRLQQMTHEAGSRLQPNFPQLHLGFDGYIRPNERPSTSKAAEFRQLLKLVQPAVVEARTLSRLRAGRYPLRFGRNPLDPPHGFSPVSRVAKLLQLDALLATDDGDIRQAVESTEALVNAAHSIGDEPVGMTQMARGALRSFGVRAAERLIAQSEPDEAALASLQGLIELEAADRQEVLQVRTDHAVYHALFQSAKAGQVELKTVLGWAGQDVPPGVLSAEAVDVAHAWVLHFMNQVVEIVKGPEHQIYERLRALEASTKEAPLIARQVLASNNPVQHYWDQTRSALGSDAMVRCAIVGIAAERFRRARGRWPDSIDALVPAQLKKVPRDSCDGRRLRMGRTGECLIVFSVWPDSKDMDRKEMDAPECSAIPQQRIDFRLWDIGNRRKGGGERK